MVRIGSKTGTLKGKLSVEPTNGEWKEFTCDLSSPITGVCDLFFTFKAGDISKLDFDCWKFNTSSTGINVLQADNSKSIPVSYDLNGRRMNGTSSSKSVRIVDGKKVIIP